MLETQVLDSQVAEGLDDGAAGGVPVLVLMHGRGADPSDLAGLRSWFPDEVAIVLPRALFQGSQWGYGPGWAWYRYEGGDRPEVESFRLAQSELEELVAGLPELLGREVGPVVLGGFSQGGTMSLGYAIRKPRSVAGVLNFSGFVPDHPDVQVSRDSARGTPIFWGHGLHDPAIPFTMAESGRKRLREAEAALEAHDYAMPHGIIPDELRDAAAWLERLL